MKYKFLRFFTNFFIHVFIRPKIEGLENIKEEGSIILAGNHTSIFDPILIMSCTKRKLYFLAKKELLRFPSNIIFNNMGLIPVDRKIKDKSVIPMAEKTLKEDKAIVIFPEGTTEKNRGLLPFKIGCVKIAHDTNISIVPFTITGKYKLFRNDIKIVFHKAYNVESNDLELENEKFRNYIKERVDDK